MNLTTEEEAQLRILASYTRDDGLDNQSGIVMDHLIAAWNAYVNLKVQHPMEKAEFANAIHTCQQLLALRVLRRIYPNGWPCRPDTRGE